VQDIRLVAVDAIGTDVLVTDPVFFSIVSRYAWNDIGFPCVRLGLTAC
jgi:hypothetical protein